MAFIEGVQSRGVGLRGQALRVQRPGDRPHGDRRRGRRAHPARDLPARPSRPPCAGRACGRSWRPTTASTAGTAASTPACSPTCCATSGASTGVVMSDWFGTHSAAALAAGLDLEMPGPANVLGHHLAAAVEAGEVTAEAVERAAQRVLDLIERTAPVAGDGSGDGGRRASPRRPTSPAPPPPRRSCCWPTTACCRWTPPPGRGSRWSGGGPTEPEVQGGGSAQVNPPYVITPLQGITRPRRRGHGHLRGRAGRSPVRAPRRPPAGHRRRRRRRAGGPARLLPGR